MHSEYIFCQSNPSFFPPGARILTLNGVMSNHIQVDSFFSCIAGNINIHTYNHTVNVNTWLVSWDKALHSNVKSLSQSREARAAQHSTAR